MSPAPNFDDLVGKDVPEEERRRLQRAHELLVQAGPPPELSPELDSVPWPEESQRPWRGAARRRSPLLIAAAVAAAALIGFVFGQSRGPSSTSFNSVGVVKLAGTSLDRDAAGTLALGKKDTYGNWSMLLHATGLQQLPEGGYYDLYLTKGKKPVVLCGSFNVQNGEVIARFSAAYDLSNFDRNGWVITRQLPGNHKPTDIVLRPASL